MKVYAMNGIDPSIQNYWRAVKFLISVHFRRSSILQKIQTNHEKKKEKKKENFWFFSEKYGKSI